MSEKHRTGRPLKDHPAGTQVTITLQVPAELKTRLQDRALKSNRTLSQEAQRRLERSFSIQALQEDAIALAVEEATARMAKQVSDLRAAVTKEADRLGTDLKRQWGDVLTNLKKSTADVQQQIERLERSRVK